MWRELDALRGARGGECRVRAGQSAAVTCDRAKPTRRRAVRIESGDFVFGWKGDTEEKRAAEQEGEASLGSGGPQHNFTVRRADCHELIKRRNAVQIRQPRLF